MASGPKERGALWWGEQAVLWGSPPAAAVCFIWLFTGSRPLVPATAFVVLFGLSMGVQFRRAVRREGVEREIMLRSAAISYPVLSTVLVATLIAVVLEVIDASTALVVALVVALFVQSTIEGFLTWRLG
jgi:hypothetical protein